eukprot:scpid55042/ scgid31624/ Para-nitrobenzyl esterase; Intracellular esterase B; PNB carboxy-esterase
MRLVFRGARVSVMHMAIVVFFICILGAVVKYLASIRRVTEYAPVADTQCGEVRGSWEQGAAVFRGIPYGRAPIGDRRWMPSLSMEKSDGSCWTGTWNASHFGNVCAQMKTGMTPGSHGQQMIGNEDCLFINVITHNIAGSNVRVRAPRHSAGRRNVLLPVAVWLHGGGLMFGSGGEEAGYAPNLLFAKNTGVVAVSFNYRLNAFGFLSLGVLDKGRGSGNYGFYDQILALKWIQENIAAFGGDKDRVTVYGQSSGGTSIVALLSSPLARGLFHGAVMMSASTTINATLAEANRTNQVFLSGSGCFTAKCLRALSTEKILSLLPLYKYPDWAGGDTAFLPTYNVTVGPLAVVDGTLLTEPSLSTISKGEGSDVRIIVGSTGQEVDIAPPPSITNYTWHEYDQNVKEHMLTFPAAAASGHNHSTSLFQEVSRLYPHDFASPPSGGTCVTGTPEYLLTSMISDIRVTCPSVLLAQYYAKYFKSPVYSYVAVQCPSATAREFKSRYAYHTWDADLLFNLSFPPKPGFKPDAKDWELVTMMQAWFFKFVRGEVPHPQWKTAEHGTFSLIYEPEMRDWYHAEQCNYFNAHGFLPYRWQN